MHENIDKTQTTNSDGRKTNEIYPWNKIELNVCVFVCDFFYLFQMWIVFYMVTNQLGCFGLDAVGCLCWKT